MEFINFTIEPILEGYTPILGNMIAIMVHVRKETLKIVKGLTIEQLDFNFDDKSNSIGTLLMHRAALERLFQVIYFENRLFTQDEQKYWHGSLPGQLYLRQIAKNNLQFYLDLLQDLRNRTLEELKMRDDSWLLNQSIRYDVNIKENIYYKLFHLLIEDEISHVGQIRMIKRRFLGD